MAATLGLAYPVFKYMIRGFFIFIGY